MLQTMIRLQNQHIIPAPDVKGVSYNTDYTDYKHRFDLVFYNRQMRTLINKTDHCKTAKMLNFAVCCVMITDKG